MAESALNYGNFPATDSPPFDRETAENPPIQELRDAAPSGSPGALPVDDLERFASDYLTDCDYRLQAARTIETRRIFIQNLLWFLRHRDYS
jgi:hypothetical protein